MKLLLCPKCGDVRKLQYSQTYCDCGYVSGRYDADGAYASVSPEATVIGLDNHTIRRALLASQVKDGGHRTICAWIMWADASRVRWEEQPPTQGKDNDQALLLDPRAIADTLHAALDEIEKRLPLPHHTIKEWDKRTVVADIRAVLDAEGYPRR